MLEILGEAAKQVPEDIRDAFPEVPWWEMAATRDRLAHGYFAVDLDVVWAIVTRDLPPVLEQLRALADSLGLAESDG